MAISDGQLLALSILADKKSGMAVPWINIADAQALTALGLARRNRSGWEITLDGACVLQDDGKTRGRRTGAILLAPWLH